MRKNLFDVFEGLNLSPDLHEYFKDSQVSSVVMSRQQGMVKINLVLNTIVHPKFIQALEEAIYAFLGYPDSMAVTVVESYELTFQLTFKDLYAIYEDSLMHTVKKHNPICFATLKEGSVKVGDNALVYSIPVTGYTYINNYKIEDLIIQVFKEKFGIDIDVEFLRDDENNQVYEEFIRNRDMEQKNLLKKHARTHQQEEKTVVKEEDITKETYENLVFGKKPATGEITKIKNFDEDTTYANVDIDVISKPDTRELRGGKMLMKFDVTDYTDSLTCKMFVEREDFDNVSGEVKKGKTLRMRGLYKFDDFDKQRAFMVNSVEKVDVDLRIRRKDNAEEKRVELHLHTQMSDMDGMIHAKDAVKQALKWGIRPSRLPIMVLCSLFRKHSMRFMGMISRLSTESRRILSMMSVPLSILTGDRILTGFTLFLILRRPDSGLTRIR